MIGESIELKSRVIRIKCVKKIIATIIKKLPIRCDFRQVTICQNDVMKYYVIFIQIKVFNNNIRPLIKIWPFDNRTCPLKFSKSLPFFDSR